MLLLPDRLLNSACDFAASRPWMLTAIIVAAILMVGAVERPM